MRRRVKVAVALLTALLGVAAAAVVGRGTFDRRISREIEELLVASSGRAPDVVTEADLASLPAPVQRWLRWAGVVGTRAPATVRITQEGRFRLDEGRDWMPFTAEQVYNTDPPGFVWRTTMWMTPGLSIVGRDRYTGGRGSIEMRLLGVVPVAKASGAPLDQGALLRYLNETMWFPAAVLGPSITWDDVDAGSARATISHGGVTAAATFIFDTQGRPADMRAERYDMASGRLQMWSTPVRAYGEFGGIRIPTEGAGVWKYATGDFSYIELRITGADYNPRSSIAG